MKVGDKGTSYMLCESDGTEKGYLYLNDENGDFMDYDSLKEAEEGAREYKEYYDREADIFIMRETKKILRKI
jgi:hypothetical protein